MSMMTIGDRVDTMSMNVLSLPDDVLFVILGHCSVTALGRLSATCQRFQRLVANDSVWKNHIRALTTIHSYACKHARLPIKEQFRLARNWNRANYTEVQVIRHGIKQIPWLQMEEEGCLWASDKHLIKCYRVKPNGKLAEIHKQRFQPGQHGDACRFKVTNHWLVAGYCDGSVLASCLDSAGGPRQRRGRGCRVLGWHTGAVHSVDARAPPAGGTVVISGSRDQTVRVMAVDNEEARGHHLNMQERVWSVALHPDTETFVVGSSGLNNVAPLSIWNTERGEFLCNLGQNYRHGAGILDLQFDANQLLYSCGYDTFVRLWDLRTSCDKCVSKWEDPFDSTVYCVKADGHNAIVSGTARHGLVRLWDRRMDRSVQMFYTGTSSSPVYSLAFNATHLYAALDRGTNMLDFSKRNHNPQS